MIGLRARGRLHTWDGLHASSTSSAQGRLRARKDYQSMGPSWARTMPTRSSRGFTITPAWRR